MLLAPKPKEKKNTINKKVHSPLQASEKNSKKDYYNLAHKSSGQYTLQQSQPHGIQLKISLSFFHFHFLLNHPPAHNTPRLETAPPRNKEERNTHTHKSV